MSMNTTYAEVEPSRDSIDRLTQPTLLESYLRSRGVRPAHLARECGYERAHLLRIRMGRIEPTPACAVGIVYALTEISIAPFPRAA